jgi:hypothetical protein
MTAICGPMSSRFSTSPANAISRPTCFTTTDQRGEPSDLAAVVARDTTTAAGGVGPLGPVLRGSRSRCLPAGRAKRRSARHRRRPFCPRRSPGFRRADLTGKFRDLLGRRGV